MQTFSLHIARDVENLCNQYGIMAPVLLLPTTMPEHAVTSIDRIGKLLRSPNDNIDCYSIQNQKTINFTTLKQKNVQYKNIALINSAKISILFSQVYATIHNQILKNPILSAKNNSNYQTLHTPFSFSLSLIGTANYNKKCLKYIPLLPKIQHWDEKLNAFELCLTLKAKMYHVLIFDSTHCMCFGEDESHIAANKMYSWGQICRSCCWL